MIVAILFVKAVGFGALAGMLALIVASIGFVAKLFAEAIEEISLKQVEAVRATGALVPERRDLSACCRRCCTRFVGFCHLPARFQPAQLDHGRHRRRGGIGGTLFAAFQRFDYDFVLTILLAIIAMIMVGEIVSGWMRRLFQ